MLNGVKKLANFLVVNLSRKYNKEILHTFATNFYSGKISAEMYASI